MLSKILFCFMFIVALISTSMTGFRGLWGITFFRFVLLFSYMIPLSLRVNLDIAKTYYSVAIALDKVIPGTIPRNSTIPEELGRI